MLWKLSGLCVGVFAAFGLAASAPAQLAPKLRVLVVTGFDVGVHDWKTTTQQTAEILSKSGQIAVTVREGVAAFESADLASFDAIVLNYGFWTAPDPSDKGKAALLAYVKSGKGLVALHFACSSFQAWTEYGEMLGRVWTKGVGGHGPRGKFIVKVDSKHPITKGIADFEIDDELYAKLSGDAKIEVLASADSDWSKRNEPIVFVKQYGSGRVVHNVLGHDTRARETPAFQTLLRRGVEWAATGKVTID